MPRRHTLLTVAQVAELVGVQPATWRGWVSRQWPRDNPAPRSRPEDALDRRTPRWREAEVRAWMARRPSAGG